MKARGNLQVQKIKKKKKQPCNNMCLELVLPRGGSRISYCNPEFKF